MPDSSLISPIAQLVHSIEEVHVGSFTSGKGVMSCVISSRGKIPRAVGVVSVRSGFVMDCVEWFFASRLPASFQLDVKDGTDEGSRSADDELEG